MQKNTVQTECYHCHEKCDETIHIEEKSFCCEGCKQVYLLLSENNMCSYYDFDSQAGISAKGRFIDKRFAYLDTEEAIQKLVTFRSDTLINITFYLPQMHCASCVYLLENLHRINAGVIKSQTNFQRKEIFISFNPTKVSLRKIVELLAFVGYEPQISLDNTSQSKKPTASSKQMLYKIGVAGFAFGNIMMLSFPDYFSGGNIDQHTLKLVFSYLSLALSIPVLFWSASEFFISAWKGLRQGIVNIDAPIALASLITFSRSYYEIVSGVGNGYLDSGTGIIFFMLIGRWFQQKTYDSFSFERDYKAYFPLGITRILTNGEEEQSIISNLKVGDHIRIRNGELIPADATLLSEKAHIDYSFISGEELPVSVLAQQTVYAGGKQVGAAIDLEITHEVSQSYITQLWNNVAFREDKNKEQSFIHPWSRYFTLVLFSIAAVASCYWYFHDQNEMWHVLSSVLIVACPCTLLLAATFTFGNMVRHFGRSKLYLKNNAVIEAMSKVDTIVFDKTGTLTSHENALVEFIGPTLSPAQWIAIKSLVAHSSHPLSRMIFKSIEADDSCAVSRFEEIKGQGIRASINNVEWRMGAANFVLEREWKEEVNTSVVHVMAGSEHLGYFAFKNRYREHLTKMVQGLKMKNYHLHILSGDNASEREVLQGMFGKEATILFNQTPQDKLDYIAHLQRDHKRRVMMLGDGLNDAGALRQANVGIAVTDQTGLFTPACDAILEGSQVWKLALLMRYAREEKYIVGASFVLSILYNIVGESYAVTANLSPIVAAVLMPISSITVIAFVTVLSSFRAKRIGLANT